VVFATEMVVFSGKSISSHVGLGSTLTLVDHLQWLDNLQPLPKLFNHHQINVYEQETY